MSIPNHESQMEDRLRRVFAEVFQQVSKGQGIPEIHVSFYPFAGLNHTIRLRKQRLYVRISDLLQDAPLEVYQALAQILVRKLFKRKPALEHERVYRQYAYQPHILEAADAVRQQRGRKQLNGSVGQAYDLEPIFAQLNRCYFANTLAQPALSWSTRRTKRILGHHDAVHDAIIISRSLDKKSVPDYVVEYVMYHEMLHIKHPPQMVNGRRSFHPPIFRAEEKRFAQYEAALQWLEHAPPRRR